MLEEVIQLPPVKFAPDFLDDPFYVRPLSDPRIIARRPWGMRPSPKRLNTGADDTLQDVENIVKAHEKRKETLAAQNAKTIKKVEKQKTEKKQSSRLMNTDDIAILKEYYPTEGFACRSRFSDYVSIHLTNRVRSELGIITMTLGKMYFMGYPVSFIEKLLKNWERSKKGKTAFSAICKEVKDYNKRNKSVSTAEEAAYIAFYIWFHATANDIHKCNHIANRVPDYVLGKALANYLQDSNVDTQKAAQYSESEYAMLNKKRAYLSKLFSTLFQETVILQKV